MRRLSFGYKASTKSINFHSDYKKPSEVLFFGFIFFVLIFFCFLIIRLFQLSIVKGNYYRLLSDDNRVKEIYIEAPRGDIIDRKGFAITENVNESSNLDKQRITSKRIYKFPEAVAHLVGYRQIANKDELKNDNCIQKLEFGDKVGKKGIEKIFDCDLRGKPGKKIIEVDAMGKYLKTLNVINPIKGKTIQLSIDLELQKKAYDLIKDKKAAIVMSSPNTGEIFIFASSPSFNPQDFEDGSINTSLYFEDKEKPLFNRIVEGTYPPGSLFKLITATASLEEKAIDEKTQFEDTGTITAGPLKFGNWYFLQYGKTDGMVDIKTALKRSNDIFFYLAGEKTGIDKIKKWAEIFGLGKDNNFGFDENKGLIPSSFWKKEILKENWYLGDTYNFSIGQGYILTTPLQNNLVAAVFANDGFFCQPKLLKNDVPNCKKIPVSQKTVNIIKEGMKQACSVGGTGWPLFDFKIKKADSKEEIIQTACKTGTAESHAKSGMPHAWISVFAPYNNPEVVLTILIEEGGQGSDVAGPLAKEILKAYFERSE